MLGDGMATNFEFLAHHYVGPLQLLLADLIRPDEASFL